MANEEELDPVEVPEEEETYPLVYNQYYNNCTFINHFYEGSQQVQQTGKPSPFPPPQP